MAKVSNMMNLQLNCTLLGDCKSQLISSKNPVFCYIVHWDTSSTSKSEVLTEEQQAPSRQTPSRQHAQDTRLDDIGCLIEKLLDPLQIRWAANRSGSSTTHVSPPERHTSMSCMRLRCNY